MKIQSQAQGTWYLVSIASIEIRAKIAHVGRGRFSILENENGMHSNVRIDASDILHYRE